MKCASLRLLSRFFNCWRQNTWIWKLSLTPNGNWRIIRPRMTNRTTTPTPTPRIPKSQNLTLHRVATQHNKRFSMNRSCLKTAFASWWVLTYAVLPSFQRTLTCMSSSSCFIPSRQCSKYWSKISLEQTKSWIKLMSKGRVFLQTPYSINQLRHRRLPHNNTLVCYATRKLFLNTKKVMSSAQPKVCTSQRKNWATSLDPTAPATTKRSKSLSLTCFTLSASKCTPSSTSTTWASCT